MSKLVACVLASAMLVAAIAQAQVQRTLDDVRSALDEGRYAEAEAAAAARVRTTESDFGTNTIQYADATDLLVEALWRNGRLNEVRPVAQRALDLRARLDPSNLAPTLRNLAQVFILAGEAAPAVELLQRAVRLSDEFLDELSLALTAASRYDDALAAIERARPKQAAAPHQRALAAHLEAEGVLLQTRGEYAKSGPLLDRALSIAESVHADHPDVARLLGRVGDQRWFEGDLQKAYDAYARSLLLAERVLRPDHPAIAVYLRNLAATTHRRGDERGAEMLRQRALALAERSLGSGHSEVAYQLNDLAGSEIVLGDYTAALALYERALQINQRRAGTLDPEVATVTYNLALTHARLRDVDEALRLHNRAIAMWQRLFGVSHPFVGLAWATLGQTFLDLDLPKQALPALQRGLTLQERALGANHRDVAQTTTDLAKAKLALGNTAEADKLSARALTIWSTTGEESGLADAASVRGDVLAALGKYDDASTTYADALAVRKRLFGPTHPDVARLQLTLAGVEARLGHTRQAFGEALEAEAAGLEHLRLMLRYLPERTALSYATTRPNGLHLAASLSASPGIGDARDAGLLFDAVIRARAVVLDEIAARRRGAVTDGDEAGHELWNSLTTARERLAFLAVAGPNGRTPAQYLSLMNDARNDKELAERALAVKSAAFSSELARNAAGLEEVRAALPVRTGLVSYSRYLRQPRGTPAYLAFVLRPGSEVRVVPLGDASPIDTAVDRWHQLAASGTDIKPGRGPNAESAYRIAGDRLRELVWDPVTTQLGDANRVLVVPDGSLNLVNLAALPIGRSEYLVERLPVIHYLGAERDVVAPPPSTAAGLLAMGGPAFDARVLTATPGQPTRGLETCVALGSLRFQPLAGTVREVSDLASLWSGETATVLTGTNATERAFKQRAPGSRVLHLATHGFFLPATCEAPVAQTRSVGGLAVGGGQVRVAPAVNAPLLLSGLALAGANRHGTTRNSDDDGILTAEEVASLNLEGVEWAVLSACDTGLGEIQAGEGVFGLRRAFQAAGVHTIIMSLWSVDDEATRAWMRSLYDARLHGGLDTADAVRHASMDLLQSRRNTGRSTHPFYWGAFVAAGDWR